MHITRVPRVVSRNGQHLCALGGWLAVSRLGDTRVLQLLGGQLAATLAGAVVLPAGLALACRGCVATGPNAEALSHQGLAPRPAPRVACWQNPVVVHLNQRISTTYPHLTTEQQLKCCLKWGVCRIARPGGAKFWGLCPAFRGRHGLRWLRLVLCGVGSIASRRERSLLGLVSRLMGAPMTSLLGTSAATESHLTRLDHMRRSIWGCSDAGIRERSSDGADGTGWCS